MDEIQSKIDAGAAALPALEQAAKSAAESHKTAKAAKADEATLAGLAETRASAEAAAKAAKEALKALRAELKAAKSTTKETRVRQNGVLQPKPETKCGIAWDIFNQISAQKKAPSTLGEAIEYAETYNNEIEAGTRSEEPISLGNLRAEYASWRKFHGVPAQGRAPKPKAEAAPRSEAAPVPQEA